MLTGMQKFIKRLSTQQTQQEGPVTLGALALSITHPTHSVGGESEGLIGAQDTGGAQVGATSHPLDVIHKLTPKAGQGLPQNKSSHCVWNPSGEKNQGIGHGQVGDSRLRGSLSVAKQDWGDITEEEDDVGQSPGPNLEQK